MTPLGYLLGGAAVVIVLAILDRLATTVIQPALQVPERSVPDLGVEHEDFKIPSGDHELAAWLLRPGIRHPSEPLIMLAHGWGASYGTVLQLAEPLAERGHDVLLFDVRGHGRNSALPYVTIRDFRDDLIAAVGYAEERFPDRKLLLIGHSMGGAAGVVAAAEGAPIDGLVLIAAPASVTAVTSEYLSDHGMPGRLMTLVLRPFWWYRLGGFFKPLTPTERISEVPVPMLILQPEHDLRVRRHHADALAAASGVDYTLIAGREHTDVLAAPETLDRVERFLERI